MQEQAIDIVVPIHNAAADVRRCVERVLALSHGDYRLVLIDDASTDPAIGAYFSELEARRVPRLALLSNDANLGFTLTANRGMRSARDGADVVLLNSDTLVTGEWLAKLARCAMSDPGIGTITPFSNNAEICSLPRFCVNNRWPEGRDPEPMARALELAAVPSYPDLPTGVGFCMYIRRALIDAIGVFDPAYGLGYGEENDFCLRAAAAGFRNVLCDDAFVLHLGGSSFGEMRGNLSERNMRVLLERHPGYLDLVRGYIAADPLKPLRELVLTQYRVLTGPRHGILHVIHGHGGGTEYQVRALIAASSDVFRHYLLIAVGDDWQLEEHVDGEIRSYDFRRLADEPWRVFLGGLAARFGIDLIHLHNISGCRDGLMAALAELDVAYGYTVHDLNFACPTITFLNAQQMYCGAVTEVAICRECLVAQPDFADVDIEIWRSKHRALLAGAAFVIAPSAWAAATLRRYFPEHSVDVIAHGAPSAAPRSAAVRLGVVMRDDNWPVVAVLGAIGPDKGARRLERLVALTRERALKLRWVLIGYLDCQREPWQNEDATFTVHGRYDARDLPDLLAHYRVRLVAYPSAGPETFSFTLSEAWAAGRPAVVPPIGALAERVTAAGGGWVLTEEEWLSEERMLDRIVWLLAPENVDALAAAAARARAAPQPTLEAMVESTIGVYAQALERMRTRASRKPIDAWRCLAAQHYVPWQPPPPVQTLQPVAPAPTLAHRGAVARLARLALRVRHTIIGRVLYRLAPRPLLAVLKARLS